MKRRYTSKGRLIIWREDADKVVWLTGTMIPGDPGCRTLRNGDPGYPPTDPDVEKLSAVDDEGNPVDLTEEEIEQAREILIRQG